MIVYEHSADDAPSDLAREFIHDSIVCFYCGEFLEFLFFLWVGTTSHIACHPRCAITFAEKMKAESAPHTEVPSPKSKPSTR